MAIKDVKKYYYTMQAQYLELKQDLEDYTEAFKSGFITEDQLEDIKAYVSAIEANYERLRYIMYLFNLPNRAEKKKRFNKAQAKELERLFQANATAEQVEAENEEFALAIATKIDELQEESESDS
jgi:hypothetical protein